MLTCWINVHHSAVSYLEYSNIQQYPLCLFLLHHKVVQFWVTTDWPIPLINSPIKQLYLQHSFEVVVFIFLQGSTWSVWGVERTPLVFAQTEKNSQQVRKLWILSSVRIWNLTIQNLETFEIWTFWRSDFKWFLTKWWPFCPDFK